MLTIRPFPVQAFRLLQEAMLLGDVGILMISAAQWAWLRPEPVLLAAQAGMAGAWGLLRLVFLFSSRAGGCDAPA